MWATVVIGLLGTAVTAIAKETVTDSVRTITSSALYSDQACWVRDTWNYYFGSEVVQDPTRFRVLVARLHGDNGTLTDKVFGAFTGERGFRPIRSCRGISTSGDDRLEAETRAERAALSLLRQHQADLLVWGEVVDAPTGVVRIWFSGDTVAPQMSRETWRIERGTLSGDFHHAFAQAIQAMALSAMAPVNEAGGRSVVELLRARLPPLRSLVTAPPASLPADRLLNLRQSLALALRTYGEQAGDNAALNDAIDMTSALLREQDRTRAPLEWGAAQNALGNSLLALGERESSTARMEQAIIAYRAALEERTRERMPLGWAMTQNNIGSAFLALGEREDGTARLQEAVVAYRAALEERTRERVPSGSATTQNNLGNALTLLGERTQDTATLEEAIRAYRAALEVRTRARMPIAWALTQHNLGTALITLGELEDNPARVADGLTAFRLALEEITRDGAPLDWAMAQNSLGKALTALGMRGNDAERLEEAAAAHRAALEEFTRDRVPLDWADAQSNLGRALALRAARDHTAPLLEQAIAAHRAALEERTRERTPFAWAQTIMSLALAEEALGDLQNDSRQYAAALDHLNAALNVYESSAARGHAAAAAASRDRIALKLRTGR